MDDAQQGEHSAWLNLISGPAADWPFSVELDGCDDGVGNARGRRGEVARIGHQNDACVEPLCNS